jgi:hypothetical protein
MGSRADSGKGAQSAWQDGHLIRAAVHYPGPLRCGRLSVEKEISTPGGCLRVFSEDLHGRPLVQPRRFHIAQDALYQIDHFRPLICVHLQL